MCKPYTRYNKAPKYCFSLKPCIVYCVVCINSLIYTHTIQSYYHYIPHHQPLHSLPLPPLLQSLVAQHYVTYLTVTAPNHIHNHTHISYGRIALEICVLGSRNRAGLQSLGCEHARNRHGTQLYTYV